MTEPEGFLVGQVFDWRTRAETAEELLRRVVAANAWGEIPWHEISDALSVYRDAIKEET